MPRTVAVLMPRLVLPAVLIAAGCTSRGPIAPSDAGPSDQRSELRPDSPIEAAMFRYAQRRSADGTIPDGALLRAIAHRDGMIDAQNSAPTGATDGPNWSWLGPGNIGGRVREVLIHPLQPDIMWTGGASGGVWKTIDGGASWQPLNDFLSSLSIGCMAMDPLDPDVIYAGTGEGFFNTIGGTSNLAAVKGAGIFRSTNGGTTWTHLNSTTGPEWDYVNRIAIDPTNTNLILAATSLGIFRSTDGGASWSQRSNVIAFDLRFDPNNPMHMVAGRRDGPPLYSTNAGLTWQPAAGVAGLRSEVRYAPSAPDRVYAAVTNTGRIKIYTSTDGGQTYALTTAGNGIQCWDAYNNVLWVDPTDENVVIMGGVWIFRSTNAGVNFSQTFGGVHADMHSITTHPDYDGVNNRTILIGCDGGVYRANDAYANPVTELNNNLGITQFYGGAIAPNGIIIGGTQDNGTLRFSGGTETWTREIGGDGGFCAADPTDSNYMYGETQRLRIYRSTNGGLTFSQVTSGLTDIGGLNTNFIPYFTLDPNNPNRMLAAARRLWRSDNMKGLTPTWSSIKPAIESAPPPPPPGPSHFEADDPRNISTITVAQGDSDVIWVGYNNGQVWKTANGTAGTPNWTRLDNNGLFPLPDRWISTIVIDPADHDVAYVAIMGWENDNLWKTVDGGQTWGDVSGQGVLQLAPAPASALAVDWAQPGRLFVGTDIGVFTSINDGVTWTVHTQGPGTVPVEQLLWKDADTLVAVTHGRGMFEADVSKPLFMGQIAIPSDPTPPGVDPIIGIEVTPGTQGLVLGSVVAMVRDATGAFARMPMTSIGADRYELTMLTTECGPAVEFYFEAMGDGGATVRLPERAPGIVFSYRIGTLESVFYDDFETNTGWSAENLGATSGDWQRGIPVNDPAWAYDPTRDSDGSGQCFLTQNELGNTDVDEGAVRLTSPNLDMSAGDVTLSYDYYLNMTNPAGVDMLLVEVSSTGVGGPWTEMARHETDGGLAWRTHTLTTADFTAAGVALTGTMRVRFTANDADPQSIVESGLDAFDLSVLTCAPCYADCDGSGTLDIFDFLCFQNSFVNGEPYACDCDPDPACDIFDFLCFQNAFVGGCP
ncbi:MAG: hypothetical protein IID31_05255 [Planctomycetes bacterium]|nr:hypothetical protein [Planctomycetota bacterium]